jgi:ParB-like chromosome segregation protein Spo0J
VKTTAPSPSSSATPTTDRVLIFGASLRRNPWNPNKMTPAMRAKLIESIREYGMLDPLTVREIPTPMTSPQVYEILDGEHRWEVASDMGILDFDCTVVRGLTEAQAKKLTIVMNELHGQADPGKLGDLLGDILKLTSLDELKIALPYDDKTLGGFLSLPVLPPLPDMNPPTAKTDGSSKEPWAERLFKMPKTVALVIDEAIEKAKDGEEIETWQALERVAADYLAS